MCDFILFLKNKIRAILELEYMCSVFTFVQYISHHCPDYEGIYEFLRSTISDWQNQTLLLFKL